MVRLVRCLLVRVLPAHVLPAHLVLWCGCLHLACRRIGGG
jgi:hypothetical protein